MIIPEEIMKIISLATNGKIWFYIIILFVLSYLFVSLLTWSFKKPLKYLGIPTLIVGILFLVLRLFSSILLNIINLGSKLDFIKTILPSILKPILINGLICFVLGIIMIITYKILDKKKQNI